MPRTGRPPGPKTRCSGQWTESKYNTFIRNLLRQGTRKWAPMQDVLKEARTERGFYHCAGCEQDVPVTTKNGRKRIKNIFVDHIEPVVDPEEGFVDWNVYIERMFSEKENFQVLCGECHDKKTSEERAKAVERRKNGTEV